MRVDGLVHRRELHGRVGLSSMEQPPRATFLPGGAGNLRPLIAGRFQVHRFPPVEFTLLVIEDLALGSCKYFCGC